MIKLSFLNLFRRKSRTFLGVVGIVIGVMAIIAIVSVVDGVYKEINDIVASYQGIMVMEKNTIDQTLSELDASLQNDLESVRGVRTVVKEIWLLPKTIDGKASGENFSISQIIYGADLTAYTKLNNNIIIGEIYRGEMLRPGDTGYVLISKKFSEDHSKFLGTTLKLDGKNFRVKGIYEAESSLYDAFFMSIEDAREISAFGSGKVSDFFVELRNPDQDKEIAKVIEFKLGDEVDAFSTSEMSEMVGGLLGSFRLVAFFVAAISGFVAGVGIINTMLMSVMERSKEIGTLKATGWTDWNIIKMILYESFFIGLIGGIVGIAFGFFAAEALKSFGLNPFVSFELVLQAFAFALAVGIIAGVYPAKRAAGLDPIEAMRGV